MRSKTLIATLALTALCLSAQARVRFTLDDATGFQDAIVMPGAVGNAVRLNGYTSYAKKTYRAETLDTRQQTISLWCAVETYPMMNAQEAENAYTSIIETIDDANHTGFALRLSSQGNIRFECYSEGWKLNLEPDVLLPKYQWNHLVVTLDAEDHAMRMYNNGELIAEGRTMNELSAGTGTMIIGKDAQNVMYGSFMLNTFNGLLDDIRIDNRILSADEINVQPANPADLIYPLDAFYGNRLRPHFHGQPMMGWTNETHGLITQSQITNNQSQTTYHLFFQKNPNGPYMARLHWGHLTSTDLCGWQEQPIAVAPSEAYDIKGCWSGCVFTDEVVTGGQPWIAYTGVDNGRATIDFAAPADDALITWQKDAANPHINGRPSGLSDDFRDPYFFRHGDKAYLIVGSSKNGVGVATLHEIRADGTITNDRRLFYQGTDAATCGTFFEMPNLTKMGDKWLFTVTPLGSNRGVRTIYWVGTINADGQFVPDNATPQTVELNGLAREGYGLLSPSIVQVDGKTIALGIVPDKLPGAVNYDMGWAHSYSLPREWTLSADGTLLQQPYSGLTALRTATVAEQSSATISGTQQYSVTNPLQVEMHAEFTIGSANCGFNLMDGKLKVCYEPATYRLIIDFRELQRKQNDSGVFDGLYATSLPQAVTQGSKLKLHLYLDHSVLDLFVCDKWASSIRLFPSTTPGNSVEIVADGAVENIGVYDLETTAKPKQYALVDPQADADAVENISSDQLSAISTQKVLRDGQLLILRDGKTYNANGVEL